MTNERYDDEVLSAIIDGDADAETVASVQANEAAVERLSLMRQAVDLVAEPTPEATPERRSASIAAAMAAATSAPQVSSLAAARHDRAEAKKRSMPRAWIGVAAAMVMFVIAIPIALSIGSDNDSADTATDAVSDGALSVDAGADSSDDSDSADIAEAAVDDAMEDADDAMDDAMEDDGDAMEDDLMADDARSDEVDRDSETDSTDTGDDSADDSEDVPEPTATPSTTRVPETTTAGEAQLNLADAKSFFTVNNLDVLDDFIAIGTIEPEYTSGEVISAGVNSACVRPTSEVTAEAPYALVNLDHFGGSSEVVLVEFADDGDTRVLDAEDCSPLG